MTNPVERDLAGNYVVNLKFAIPPDVYHKLLTIVDLGPYDTLSDMISKYLSRELGYYNGVNVWIARTIKHIDDRIEGRD